MHVRLHYFVLSAIFLTISCITIHCVYKITKCAPIKSLHCINCIICITCYLLKNDDRPTHTCPNNWMIKKCQKSCKYSCDYHYFHYYPNIICLNSFRWFLDNPFDFPDAQLHLHYNFDYNGHLWSKGILSAGTRLNVRWHIKTIISIVNLGISVARLYKKFYFEKQPRELRNNSDSLRFSVRWTSVTNIERQIDCTRPR